MQEREGEKTERDKQLAIRAFRFRVLPCLREIELPGRDTESRERKPSSKRRISVENDGFTYVIIIWFSEFDRGWQFSICNRYKLSRVSPDPLSRRPGQCPGQPIGTLTCVLVC